MANYDSNYAIAQEISARIGNSPIPFDSVYSIALEIYNELGGEPSEFDSVYEILLSILPLVEGGIASKVIDDNSIVLDKTWSSSKINEEIQAVAGTANSDIEGKETEDIRFVSELPVDGEEGEQVVIRGENSDTLYKYINGAWVSQTPDATKLYFDVENEALYSYVTADGQFAPVSMVNTIVVGSNLNSNAALKAIKTPGVYSVVQRLTNKTKGDYIKNWTLTVEGIDYDEYDRSDSIYQRIQSNYTIQKRTWSATRTTNDGWSSFSTYYAGEIKDSTTSKYYTWSSNKISTELANIPQLESGENIEIADNKINAKGYIFDSTRKSFIIGASYQEQTFENSGSTTELGLTDLRFSGAANSKTYTYGGESSGIIDSYAPMLVQIGYGFGIGDGSHAFLTAADTTNHTVTFDTTLNANNALSNELVTQIWQRTLIYISGAASATTYNYVDTTGFALQQILSSLNGRILHLKVSDYNYATVITADTTNNTITFENTLDAENAVSNAECKAYKTLNIPLIASGSESVAHGYSNTASGDDSHAEGRYTTATAQASHAEGQYTIASGQASHAEGWGSSASPNTASGYASHVEGGKTIASGSYSHAEGYETQALGNNSHAEGYNTIVYGGHVEGYWNIPDNTETTVGSKIYNSRYTNIVGNGHTNNRSNAYTLGLNGKGWYQTDVMCGGSNEDTAVHKLSEKQDTLTAGTNIEISGTTISATYSTATTAEIEALFN